MSGNKDIPNNSGEKRILNKLHIRNTIITALMCAVVILNAPAAKADTLAKTEYGDTVNKTNPLYFKWEPNADNNYIFTLGSVSDKDITYYVKAAGTVLTNTKDTGTLTNPPGTSYINLAEMIGGASVANPAGTTITINDTLFKDNRTTGKLLVTTSYAWAALWGGALYNAGNITEMNADFVNNGVSPVFEVSGSATGGSIQASGGAIANKGEIGNINGDFVQNFASVAGSRYTATAEGGAISNELSSKIGDISGNFIGNYASSIANGSPTNYHSSDAHGGAISNKGEIKNITGDFIGNYAIGTTEMYSNTSSYGGAIYNIGTIGNITGNFIGNYAVLSKNFTQGGAIYNSTGIIGDIIGDFIGNYACSDIYGSGANGGAIYNEGRVGNITGNFIGNYVSTNRYEAQGGAIYNKGQIASIKNSSFINNSAKGTDSSVTAQGGAIYNKNADLTIMADNGTSVFSGNYVISNGSRESNAIYMATAGDTLTLNAKNNGTILFDDKINGLFDYGRFEGYKLHITGDTTGKIILNNSVNNASVILDTTNLYLGKDEVFNNSLTQLTLNSGSLSMVNNSVGTIMLARGLTLNGSTAFSGDVDLENKKMDRIISGSGYTINPDAKLNVNYLNLLNDAAETETKILFADTNLANNVAYTGASPIAYSPIYKYQVDYLKETGEFLFTRGAGGSSSNPSDNFNPSVLPTPVNNQAGGYTTQLQTFNYAFQHSDTFMQIPAAQRFAIKNQNKYALSPTGDATDVGVFSPLLTKYETGGIWFKPYASFENIPLKNGPKVNNINYGTLIGFDSNLKSIKHGWERVLTGYIGYNGATQNFSGVTSNQNGGILGTTATFYKGNFFNATTLSVGATAGSNNTMYGSEDYTMLLAGIADKFGYNFEFKEGKYIIQPSMLLSYSFVNTFDYRNAAGVNIQSDPLNALQLAPGIKFIMNTKNGWQPYIGVNMVWNIMDQTKVKANDVRLPSMSIDPYVEYGVGVQRKWGERFMGYAQAMVHNGGRNGISLNGGFRWAIGKK